MDYSKVADIMCLVTSAKGTNFSNISLDPYNACEPFDEHGYAMLHALRIQGLPAVCGVIQHVEGYPQRQQQKIFKLFARFLGSELLFSDKFVGYGGAQDTVPFLRVLQFLKMSNQPWRDERGYLLADSHQFNQQTGLFEVSGFLKGSCISANQIIHITGQGDFEIERVEIQCPGFLVPKHRRRKIAESLG